MAGAFLKKFFGSANDRIISKYNLIVDVINKKEAEYLKLTDLELQNKTGFFKEQLAAGKNLDDILPDAFAAVREASRRVLNMRHFDVQLLGGIILHKGAIAQMGTGEGKTLVATLAVYLNALTQKGVHVVSVNDYLIRRDAEWMGKIYNFLGLSVGCITNDINNAARVAAYKADITYGTNNEFGFDYLRDNMRYDLSETVQRGCNFAIIDEVDSILIDEARTPLIISGPTEDNSTLYYVVDKLVAKLSKEDFEIDEKARNITLTDDGSRKIEDILKDNNLVNKEGSLYDIEAISVLHHVNQALRAHNLFVKDKDYIVKDNKVIIIDEFTGRMMEGRRYSEGMHQALEAKENVPVQNENQTLASVTFQNYFRLYDKLAGMTGTAMTEAEEFADIYKLDVIAVPSNKTTRRLDEDDEIYQTEEEKYNAIIASIKEAHQKGQPVLVGTTTIDKSEYLAKLLKKEKISHNVLNAKQHEKEAYIIAQAGRYKAVTIATNMAGRGTDIILGGNLEMLIEDVLAGKGSVNEKEKEKIIAKLTTENQEEKAKVIAAGGLYVLGTERHESRRIDNQLRGRAGRQGDPGTAKFFLSLQDDLLRIFGADRISSLLQKLKIDHNEAITHPWINKTIARAQGKVEQMHFDMRKNILRFDDVMNDQRKVIYKQRIEYISSENVTDTVKDMIDEVSEEIINTYIPPKSYPENWDIEGLTKEVYNIYGIDIDFKIIAQSENVAEEEILKVLDENVDKLIAGKYERYGAEVMQLIERKILLLSLDQLWKDHLLSLDHLKQGINLRAYGQKDPLSEYKKEAFFLFGNMLNQLNKIVASRVTHVQLGTQEHARELAAKQLKTQQKTVELHANPDMITRKKVTLVAPAKRVKPEDRDPNDISGWGRVARNEPCPCGSGKKYKQCHGAIMNETLPS